MRQQDRIIDVIKEVQSWSPAERLSLLHELLATLEGDLPAKSPRPSFERAAGIIKVDPAPSDEDIRRMIDKHRMEKYG